ncbi:MAG: hypothetical protein RL172_1519 [Bacteroidota bacterium]
MKLTIKKLLILVVAGNLLYSCQKLDVNSPVDVPTELVFKNADGLRSALTGLYSNLQQRDYYGGYYPLMADLNSDVCTAGGYDVPAINDINAHAISNANVFVEKMYLSIYKVIANANEILAVVDDLKDANLSDDERAAIKGQTLAIRALAHFDALRMFGYHWDAASAYGIPVVTAPQKAYDVVQRSTVANSYTAIITDLTAADALLDGAELSAQYANSMFAKALLARVYLYQKNYTQAAAFAQAVIDDGTYSLVEAGDLSSVYTGRLSAESIFELSFDAQNQSFFNGSTYVRDDALRTEIFFLANQGMSDFFAGRPDDQRSQLLDFTNNDVSILPDGRTQKYRGEVTKDNPAYIIRIAELYLIAAEAKGLANGGLELLNSLREHRGLAALTVTDVPDNETFVQAVLDERLAELNFEGHRFFDLARLGKIEDVLEVDNTNAVFPIPQREITATNNTLQQNPGY